MSELSQNNTKNGELLPCPFCGGEAFTRSVNGGILPWIVEERGGIPEKYYTTCTLWCDTCGAQIEGYSASDITTEGLYKRAIENCYTAWNTRSVDTCENVGDLSHGASDIFECSECGYGYRDIYLNDEDKYPFVPNYCPNCGAKVVGE